MKNTLDKGDDKIQMICDALRKETLEPAKAEAEEIIHEAKHRAERIIKEAHEQANHYLEEAKQEIDKERNVFHSSLEQAGKQALEELRQSVEHDLFSDELQKIVSKNSSDPKVIAKLIEAIVKAIEKEGIATDLSAVIPQAVSIKEMNSLLGDGVLKKLSKEPITLGQFSGGAQVKLHDKKMTVDITDKTLMELLTTYIRKDFRKLLFKD